MTHLLHLNTHTRGRFTHTPPSSDYTLDPPNWTPPLPNSEDWVTNHGVHLAVENSKPHIVFSPNVLDFDEYRQQTQAEQYRRSSDV
ncbi:hypothetical protein PQX77_015957 [Marasmius sp. AFHP31]|nr:hypothetical protein PQX77_015957 [Marasmius sp. AFHP31]